MERRFRRATTAAAGESLRVGCRVALLASMLMLGLVAGAGDAEAKKTLTLRVNDAEGAPGDLVAVVVRTYSPRPIRQGQIAVRVRKRGRRANAAAVSRAGAAGATAAVRPFVSLESYQVLSQNNDAQATASFKNQGGGQLMTIRFESPSGTVNRSDGPLAVLYLRLSPQARPGDEFQISVDEALSSIIVPNGTTVPIRPRPGRLRVRGRQERPELDVGSDTIRPGETALVTVSTREPIPMSQGQLALRYDADVFVGTPSVTLDPKHGDRKFDVDNSRRGLVVVQFRSDDGSWNLVPGDVVEVRLPSSPSARPGSRSKIRIDRSRTELLDSAGEPIEYKFRKGTVRFEAGDSAEGIDFQGPVRRVSGATFTLANGERVATDTATYWDPKGDFTSVAEIAAGLAAGKQVRVDGEGTRRADGSLLASEIRARAKSGDGGGDDGDGGSDDGDAPVEFEDTAKAVDPSQGTVTLADDTVVRVDGATQWRVDGDFLNLDDVAAALAAGDTVKIDGEGSRQDDGSILATKIRARRTGTDDGGGDEGTPVEFEGDAEAVDTVQRTITLADDTVVRVDDATEWRSGGDFSSLEEVATALAAGDTVKIDGEGSRQDDGSILATEIRARRDD